jgi:glycosyltransferase involved in cell wall biosynthesis
VTVPPKPRILVVHGAPPGVGGLGAHAAQVLRALSEGADVVRAGPGRCEGEDARSHTPPRVVHPLVARYTTLRWYQGAAQLLHDRGVGRWAAEQAAAAAPELCYTFTQVGLETLRWANARGIHTVLDNPNGHIADHRKVCVEESERWCGGRYRGHPSASAVRRVEEEYERADRIRVSSEWAKQSMVERGVPEQKITVVPLSVDAGRFPAVSRTASPGPLRVGYTGSLSLGKGFVYLLKAVRAAGAERFALRIAGATGDRCSRRLFQRESAGLAIEFFDTPLQAYSAAEVFVLPSLHDGFGFVAAEAMATGLPAIVTERCGAAEWVRASGGVVLAARDIDALAEALNSHLEDRSTLGDRGAAARAEVVKRGSEANLTRLAQWVLEAEKR